MPIVADSIADTYQQMRSRLLHVVPDIELCAKAELVWTINQLKRERNALILGHNYMEPALYHTVADHVGDSLELCRKAAAASADVIVFCGVRFMAETAKILNPAKTVLLPSLEAGCSLAASITASDVRHLRRCFPDAPVVSYVNTYAEVKAESDVCCTSGNAAAVVESLDADVVILIPDEYLTANTARETGRRLMVVDPQQIRHAGPAPLPVGGRVLIAWPGRCEVHEHFSVSDVIAVRKQFPGTEILAHPECAPAVVQAADFAGSTSAMSAHVRRSNAESFLLLTECSMADNIAAENPGKEMLGLCSVRCPHMNAITLELTLEALQYDRHTIEVPPEIADRAQGALHRMLRT